MVVSEQFARYCILFGGPLGVTSQVVECGGQSVQVSIEEEWLPSVARQHNAVSTLSWFASNFGTPELRNLKGGGAIHQFVNIAAFLAAPVRRRIVLITSGENLTWGVRQIGDPGLLTCAITTVEQASLFVAATGFAASTIESLMTRLQRLQPDSEEVRQLDRLLRLRV